MNTAFWNCRGLKGSLVVRRLKGIKSSYFPDVLFLLETKNPDDVVRDVAAQLGYDNVKCVSPRGMSGGLALMWNKSVSVVFNSADVRLIDCKISNKDASFYFSCVYGHPNRKLRHILWERMQRISLRRKGPWLMCGDFNEILNASEKRGGRVRENWSFVDFRNMVQICKVSDLPFKGNNMTWAGKRNTHNVECWLDRALANDEWKALFPASEVEYLEMVESDHRPAVIKIRKVTEQGTRPFYFDKRLCKVPEVAPVIEESWNMQFDPGASVNDRIRNCRREIGIWKRANNTNSAKRIKELISIIDKAHTDHHTSTKQIQELRFELLKAYREEETYWHQKSRIQWLKEGDRNTRFFHASTKNRIARNRLTTIQGQDGIDIHGNAAIAAEAERYFSTLFTSGGVTDLSKVLSNIQTVVTDQINADLTRDITTEEIRKALFSIGATKTPGPDGFTAAFYQHFWDTVGSAIVTEVKLFSKQGSFQTRGITPIYV